MAKEPFEQFGMPKEIRAFVEQSVTQAKHAFDGFIQAANQAMGQFEGQAQAARGGANEIAHKSMAYAEQNMAATFEFAEKLMQAKDATEVMRLQSAYLGLADAGAFNPGPGAWTKCCQNGGGCCKTSAVIPAQRTPPDKI
jgi:phasin